jgi:hypothetical protein
MDREWKWNQPTEKEALPAAARGAANLPQPHAPNRKRKTLLPNRAHTRAITKPRTDKTPTPLFFNPFSNNLFV